MVASRSASVELTCYEVSANRVDLRPAPRKRAWMDETPNAFAYRCVPLAVANTHGWEMLCPFAFEAVWLGGQALGAVQITAKDDVPPAQVDMVASHFGSGILTFNPLVILRTEPHYDLWLSGPVNSFKDGIQPMNAVIETDWMPYTFSFSWKFTRTGTVVQFEKGEPFCSFFPVRRGVIAECEPRIRPLSDAPELNEQYRWALARRNLDDTYAEETRDQFQGWYKSARMPDGSDASVEDHQTSIKAKPFTR